MSLVLVITATRSGPLATATSWGPLTWIRVRSYGLYLWSWPVQLLVEEHLDRLPRFLSSVLIVAISIAARSSVAAPRRDPAATLDGLGTTTRAAPQRLGGRTGPGHRWG